MNMLLYIQNFTVLTAASASAKADPNWLRMVIISVVIGLLVGLIYALILKGSLTSVHRNDAAADYVRPGSFKLEREQDSFMYSETDKKEKPKDRN